MFESAEGRREKGERRRRTGGKREREREREKEERREGSKGKEGFVTYNIIHVQCIVPYNTMHTLQRKQT